MMGHALRQDLQNPDRGVVIEKSGSGVVVGSSASVGSAASSVAGGGLGGSKYQTSGQFNAIPDPMVSSSMTTSDMMVQSTSSATLGDAMGGSSSSSTSLGSPFMLKIMAYIHRHHVPFEYMDAWVPSFVPDANGAGAGDVSESGSVAGSGADGKGGEEKQPKCRLCFAGSMVAKQVVVGDTTSRRAVPLSADDQFNLSAFGDYSESFSFDVGCGLPGRVYHMGVPTWEQSVHNAPLHHYERVGGSQQWGIRTVVGIPVPSPNVGRIVVVLYSRHDRAKDHDLVIRLTEEFSRLMPSPKWKLVVDVGQQPQQAQQVPTQQAAASQQQVAPQAQQPQQVQPQQQGNGAPPAGPAALTSEVISIFGEHMPSDPNDPAFAYLQGFMSLRLLLLRSSRTEQEQDIVNTILSSYSSYKAGGRTRPDIALMLARDFMFLNQQQPQQMHQQQQQQQQPLMQQQQMQMQQSYAPAPAHVQQQQQQQMFSPTLSSTSAGSAMNSMPPPSPHGSSGSLMQQQHLPQDQQPQYHQQPQQYQDNLMMGLGQDMMTTGGDGEDPQAAPTEG